MNGLQAADALAPAPAPVPAPAPAPDLAPSPGDAFMPGGRRGRGKNVGVDGRAPKPWDVAANGQEVRSFARGDTRHLVRRCTTFIMLGLRLYNGYAISNLSCRSSCQQPMLGIHAPSAYNHARQL